jgi:hypothetical protein
MNASGPPEVIVHLMVDPGAGVTPKVKVCELPGQVGAPKPAIQSVGGLIGSVSEHDLLHVFASVTVRFTVTVPVIFGMLMLTVEESLPTGEAAPPLYDTVQA